MKRGWNDNRRESLVSIYVRKTIIDPLTECHYWTGAKDRYGYGSLTFNQQRYQVHKFFYELFIGVVNLGYELHHTCNNGHKGCINPFHLKEVTKSEHGLINWKQRHDKIRRRHSKYFSGWTLN